MFVYGSQYLFLNLIKNDKDLNLILFLKIYPPMGIKVSNRYATYWSYFGF